MHEKYPHLFEPLYLPGLTLKNRIFSSPTSVAELGPNESFSTENIEYYKMRAASGAAKPPSATSAQTTMPHIFSTISVLSFPS